jgi:hypothetical protein
MFSIWSERFFVIGLNATWFGVRSPHSGATSLKSNKYEGMQHNYFTLFWYRTNLFPVQIVNVNAAAAAAAAPEYINGL